ncbi:MAG: hypothetical protein IJ578_06025 [Bacteroidales bacterium]|nr:hypothetical protein [Bacteroidales bacterium]
MTGVKLTVAANTTYETRTATLTFKAGTASATFQVSQAGRTKPADPDNKNLSKSLVTADPTPNAKALFDYFLGVYGKKTVSSVVADVNWNYKEAEKIHTATGKYPAINCYDFIQIYVPSGNNWINYNDLTPVTDWYDAGGIVSLMWHFNVPRSESTVIGTDGSGVTCSPSETTFKASNALVSGTWENKWFYDEMDKVIEVILKLQEKGIAATWRPFHEAAGNATLKESASWATSWFWWGADGAETYKKLWKAMFEHFGEKGVRNLIWVWTTQNFNGDSSKYNQDKDWYPGDAYVDMVGRDLYGTSSDKNAQEWDEIQKAYPKKMVCLAECGNAVDNDTKKVTAYFPKLTDVWNAGAYWLSFMPWYGANMPDNTWWKDAMNSEIIISRDELPSDLFTK